MPLNRRILIIDDSPAIHQDFRKILGLSTPKASSLDADESMLFGDVRSAPKEEGYEIDSALQGREGLEMVARANRAGRPYALTFTDMRMPPGWDGVETLERILKELPTIELCICSAYSDYSWHEVIRRLDRPGIRLIRKPFETHEVLSVAAELTNKWNKRNPGFNPKGATR
jgi:CheY-like chemotaxis protein